MKRESLSKTKVSIKKMKIISKIASRQQKTLKKDTKKTNNCKSKIPMQILAALQHVKVI